MATNQFSGIIPYGSTDTSVILQCSLKSSAEVTAVGGSIPNAGTVDFDSVKGASSNAINGGIRFTTPTGYAALDISGQVSFDVETKGICLVSSSIFSQGTDYAGNVYFLVLRQSAATNNYLRMYFDSNERINVTWNTGGASTSTTPSSGPVELTTLAKSDYSTITISWENNKYDLYINGKYMFTGQRSGLPAANIGERIEIASGAGLGNCVTGLNFRNLVVATRPVRLYTHPLLNKVAFVGHSYILRAGQWNPYTQAWRDESIALNFRARLNTYGLNCNLPTDGSSLFYVSGGTILNSGGTPISSYVTSAAAYNPSCVVYIAGINDTTNASWATNRAQTLTDLKSHCTTLLGATNCKMLIVANSATALANTSSYTSSNNDKNNFDFNYDVSTLPTWWNTNNPTRVGQLAVFDMYTAMGKNSPDQRTFVGSIDNSLADLHPTAYGCKLIGEKLADTLVSNLYF
jgi:hypothetical protein